MRHLLILAAAASLSTTASAQTRPIYKSAAQPIDIRVNDLLRRMTLEEKVAQMEAIAPGPGRGIDSLLQGGDTAQYGAKGKRLSFGAITGAPRGTPRQRAEAINRLQKYFIEETRLGIPIIVTDEALHGVVITQQPVGNVDEALRAWQLPAGRYRLKTRFITPYLRSSLAISVAALLLYIIIILHRLVLQGGVVLGECRHVGVLSLFKLVLGNRTLVE